MFKQFIYWYLNLLLQLNSQNLLAIPLLESPKVSRINYVLRITRIKKSDVQVNANANRPEKKILDNSL
jgi:hypothetical protein